MQEEISATVDSVLEDQRLSDIASNFEPVSNLDPSPKYYRMAEDGFTKIPVSRLEYKKHMREHFTVQHKRLPLCGHKLVLQHEPKFRNCESCWFAFFQVHGELTRACDEVFNQFGESGLRQLRGPKFTQNYTKFMSTLAQWKKAAEAANPGDTVQHGI